MVKLLNKALLLALITLTLTGCNVNESNELEYQTKETICEKSDIKQEDKFVALNKKEETVDIENNNNTNEESSNSFSYFNYKVTSSEFSSDKEYEEHTEMYVNIESKLADIEYEEVKKVITDIFNEKEYSELEVVNIALPDGWDTETIYTVKFDSNNYWCIYYQEGNAYAVEDVYGVYGGE